ncbi:unnamed protein product [Didymodactylos carnosus]|uniref:Inosine/uridine-preferring nucleoside hydrolase domain-containing protein n=1 Tax=Didymodactylos carnosus TaxID=1234261 RepID=A0A814VBG5_9BILA|nr:unnamed protein product [Didymodactylos carnosus]CAF3953058.1 unnamed protein product [Didymodactylos carnosus]
MNLVIIILFVITTIAADHRRPVIIDTDADVDDLFAIAYLLNVPTIKILAITTVGNAFTTPFYTAPIVLTLLSKLNCEYGVPVAYGERSIVKNKLFW